MVTSVQLSDSTKRLLNRIRIKEKKTYDAVIRDLVLTREGVSKSFFGKTPDIPAWSKADRARTRDD